MSSRPITFFFALTLGVSASAADALSVMATLKSGQSNPGYLVKAEADGLVISSAPVGGNSAKVPYANIQQLNVEEPKGWGAAVDLLKGGNYAEAERAFAQLADDYEALVLWKDGFGAVARLNHLKAMKGQGKLKELAAAMDRQLAKPLALGDLNKVDFNDLRGWAILGKGDMQALQSYLNEFQEAAGKWGILPLFNPALPGRVIASLAYLRGRLNEQNQKPDLAFIDYHTAMTWNNGSDAALFKMACLDALKIAAAKTAAKPDDQATKRTAHFLAVSYRDIAGKGSVPKEYAALLEAIPEPADAPEKPADSEAEEAKAKP